MWDPRVKVGRDVWASSRKKEWRWKQTRAADVSLRCGNGILNIDHTTDPTPHQSLIQSPHSQTLIIFPSNKESAKTLAQFPSHRSSLRYRSHVFLAPQFALPPFPLLPFPGSELRGFWIWSNSWWEFWICRWRWSGDGDGPAIVDFGSACVYAEHRGGRTRQSRYVLLQDCRSVWFRVSRISIMSHDCSLEIDFVTSVWLKARDYVPLSIIWVEVSRESRLLMLLCTCVWLKARLQDWRSGASGRLVSQELIYATHVFSCRKKRRWFWRIPRRLGRWFMWRISWFAIPCNPASRSRYSSKPSTCSILYRFLPDIQLVEISVLPD